MPRDGFYRPESFISPGSRYGLLRSATPDRTVWLYAKIPWTSALLDGAGDSKRREAEQSFMSFFDGLAGEVSVAGMRYRDMLKGEYREFHLLTGSMPVPYSPPVMQQDDLSSYQAYYYRNLKVRKQFAVIGVPLRLGGEQGRKGRKQPFLRKATTKVNQFCFSFANGYAMFDEYLPDAYRIERIMLNAGFIPFTVMEEGERERMVAMMESWWVSRASSSALPIFAENDHLHFFPDSKVCQNAKRLYDKGIDCDQWDIDSEYPASICFARTTRFAQSDITDPANLWIAKLMEVSTAGGANAVATSVRGKVEPGKVTADTIRRNARTIDENIKERYQHGREASADMADLKYRLDYKKAIYNSPEVPPSVIDLSIATCVAGNAQIAVDALQNIPNFEFTNLATANEQLMAFKSMQACSPVRMTPYEIHWSSTCVAGGGVSSFARAGDETGALVGLTEANRQPVYVSTTTVQDRDTRPGILVIGETGSGKSMLLVSLFLQWMLVDSRSGKGKTPCILINPKEGNDFEDATHSRGGTVLRLDSDIADGTFDPYNVLRSEEEAKDMAAIMIADILKPDGDTSYELTVKSMLDYGYKHGGRCCGTILQKAANDFRMFQQRGIDPAQYNLYPDTLNVFKLITMSVNTNQSLRLIFGTNDNVTPLRVSQNLTLINAGDRSMIPEKGAENTVTGRIQRWVLRMTVFGAGAAVSERDGMVGIDEAWAILGEDKGAAKVNEWMRTARSRRFTPIFASQKVKEFIDAGMTGGIGRAFLLALDDPIQDSPARDALRLLQIEDSGDRIRSRMPLGDRKENNMPNWAGMRRLKDKGKDGKERTIRGAVAYFKDSGKQPVPVEVIIPPDLLKEISTTATDKIRREEEKRKTMLAAQTQEEQDQ